MLEVALDCGIGLEASAEGGGGRGGGGLQGGGSSGFKCSQSLLM